MNDDANDPSSLRWRRALVRAGRVDRRTAPPELRARVMALASPVVVATAVTTATSTTATSVAKANSVAPGAGGAAAKAGSSAILWKAVGLVIAIGAVASAIIATYSEERTPPVAVPALVVSPPPEPAPTPVVAEPAPPPIEVAPEIRPVAPPKPVVETRRSTPVAAPPTVQAEEPPPQPSKPADTSRLADEMRHIEAIRAASNAKRHGEALRLLEEYRAAFPTGVLSEEAEAMRIESLARLGRTGAAAALARRFLKERPNSPYTSSVAATLASLPELPPDE